MLSHDHLRILDDSATTYAAWLDAQRAIDALGPKLRWKSINGQDYLYELFGGTWGASHGVRNAATEKLFEDQQALSAQHDGTIQTTQQRLGLLASQYRALGLPRVHPVFGKICRAADIRGMLGTSLLVVGTNAMPAYEVEAQERFLGGLNETQDCDFAWAGAAQFQVSARLTGQVRPKPFYALVKSIDDYFTVNSERPFQMRNRTGYEVELLIAPSMTNHYPKTESVRPIPMPEQEWLLLGRQVSHVVFDTSNQPVRLVVPDPRWMALHKLWLSQKPERNNLKKPKDQKQGAALAAAVAQHMSGYPIDEAFRASVSTDLLPFLRYFDVG